MPGGYRAVVFDIDGTIVEPVSSWRYIHEKLGKWDVLAFRYQELFQAGKITYRQFCKMDAVHWKGMREDEMAGLFHDVRYFANVETCMRRLRKKGLRLMAVSTGLQFLAEKVKRELGFERVECNRLKHRAGVLTGGVEINIPHGGKGRMLKRMLKEEGIDASAVVGVGDSEGDIPMTRVCGYSIAFNVSCGKLARSVDYVCKTKDFKEVCTRIESLTKGEG